MTLDILAKIDAADRGLAHEADQLARIAAEHPLATVRHVASDLHAQVITMRAHPRFHGVR